MVFRASRRRRLPAFTVVHDIPPLKKAKGCEAADWGCARGKSLRLRLRRPTDRPAERLRKPPFFVCGMCKAQGECAVDVPTCEREPLTKEKVLLACRLRFQDRTVSSSLDLVCRPLFIRQAILFICYVTMCGDRQVFNKLCCRKRSETRSIEHFSLLAWAQKYEGGQCRACPTRA